MEAKWSVRTLTVYFVPRRVITRMRLRMFMLGLERYIAWLLKLLVCSVVPSWELFRPSEGKRSVATYYRSKWSRWIQPHSSISTTKSLTKSSEKPINDERTC